MKNHLNRVTAIVCAVVSLLFLFVFCVINFRGFGQFCTGDIYSDTYLVRVMWESGTIFPENWIFGNQFYVISTPVLAALIYGLCGSINLSMILATTAMTLLTIVCFWWMLRPFASRTQILLGLTVLLGSVIGPDVVATIEGQIFYLMASYYAGYLITMFVVFGDYVRTLHNPERKGTAVLILAVFLSFGTGMQSLRQTAVMVFPLLAAEAIRLLLLWLRRTPVSSWNIKATVRVALYTAANLSGMAAIKVIAPNCVTMYGELSFNPLSRVPECLSTCLRALRSISGLKYLDSETPLLGVIALVLVLATVIALLSLFLRRRKWDGCDVLMILFGASILCTLGVSVVVNIYTRSIYIFPWYPLAALAAVVLFSRLRISHRAVATALLLIALLGNLFLSYGSSAEKACSDAALPERQVAQYLMDEGYSRVYGPWMWVDRVAVWTDGQVAAGSWYGSVCQVIPYITPTDIFSEADNAKACYLTINAKTEQELLDFAASQGAEMTLLERFEGTSYCLYTSSKQLMFFGAD